VVLDEPNANLDTEGEAALALAIRQLRRRKAIVVVVSHRPDVLKELDMVLALGNGVVIAFGSQEKLKAALVGSQAGKQARPTGAVGGMVQPVAAAEAAAP
jgi:ABC-type protease/lipase transport system fused ATPase/permease subunit